MVRVAVIGHVEWVTHALGPVPTPGDIVHLRDAFDEPAGGGAVAAVAAAALGARCLLFTAVGNDAAGQAVVERLAAQGVEVAVAHRDGPHPRALTIVDDAGERTIMTTGERLTPTIDDDLPWGRLSRCDAVYFTGDDPRTLIAARAARHLVVSARRAGSLEESGVAADVLVGSGRDAGEAVDAMALRVPPRAQVITAGVAGGRIVVASGEAHYAAALPDGPAVDAYGAGDSFAAGLTVGLARGLDLPAAASLGARTGARAVTARGGLAPHTRAGS